MPTICTEILLISLRSSSQIPGRILTQHVRGPPSTLSLHFSLHLQVISIRFNCCIDSFKRPKFYHIFWCQHLQVKKVGTVYIWLYNSYCPFVFLTVLSFCTPCHKGCESAFPPLSVGLAFQLNLTPVGGTVVNVLYVCHFQQYPFATSVPGFTCSNICAVGTYMSRHLVAICPHAGLLFMCQRFC